jgi:hypothetical protein
VKNIPGNRHLTVQGVGEDVGISIGSSHTLLMEDSGMHQGSAKFVPRLTDDLQRANGNKNLSRSVDTSDKTWVYGYGVETKRVITLEESYFALSQESTTGALVSVSNAACFPPPDHQGIVHYEFFPEGHTVH